ncbi:hypothetical protein Tco_1038735, partial [Tanacetum coccineum]
MSQIKGFSKLKGAIVNSWAKVHAGREISSSKTLIGQSHKGNATLDMRKHTRSGFLYSGYSQKKYRGHITDCHVGNPYVYEYDPTNMIRDPIIEGIQGVRLEGAWEESKGLE